MFNDLVLVHQKSEGQKTSQSPVADFGQLQNWFYLPTCLRKIAVGPSSQIDLNNIDPELEVYQGANAYRFMLEVICGLKSPLVGETEIFGQFKTAATQYEALAGITGSAPIRKFLRALNEDAKKVRELHLKDLGSQSYGSLVRKELKGIKQIVILGAGQLTKEILPWLGKDGAQVHVCARDKKRAEKNLSSFANLQIHEIQTSLFQINEPAALIVSAPVEAQWLENWARLSKFKSVIDLRGDSHLDVAQLQTTKTVLLKELLERITENQTILHERKDRALKEINQAVLSREQHVEYRPFGWEDVCA